MVKMDSLTADGLSWQGTKFRSSGVFAGGSELFICLPLCYRIALQSINKHACPGGASLRHKHSALTQSFGAVELGCKWGEGGLKMQYLFRELRKQIYPGKVFVYGSGMKTLQWMPKNREIPQIVAWEWREGIMLLQMQG